jgi:hypothetical protein
MAGRVRLRWESRSHPARGQKPVRELDARAEQICGEVNQKAGITAFEIGVDRLFVTPRLALGSVMPANCGMSGARSFTDSEVR